MAFTLTSSENGLRLDQDGCFYSNDILHLDPDGQFFQLLIVHNFGFSTCMNCGTSYSIYNTVQKTYGKKGMLLGCARCKFWVAKLDDKCYAMSNSRYLTVPMFLKVSDSSINNPLCHGEDKFYGFTCDELVQAWPSGVLALNNTFVRLYNDHSFWVKDAMRVLVFGTQPKVNKRFGQGYVDGKLWAVFSHDYPIPSLKENEPIGISSIPFPKHIFDRFHQSYINGLQFIDTIRKAHGKSKFDLTLLAKRCGIFPPELPANFQTKIDGLLSTFGDPKKIMKRKHFRLRTGGSK